MKKVLYLLTIVLSVVGCSKETDSFDPILVEYGLQNKFDNTENIKTEAMWDSLIYFTGKLKNSDNIGLVVSDMKTKNKLIDIIPFVNNEFNIYQPYEGEVTVKVENIQLYRVIQNTISNLAVISTNGYNNSSRVEHSFFIKDNKVINSFSNINSCVSSEQMFKWGNNFILFNCVDRRGYFLFDPSGNVITEVIYGRENYGTDYDFGKYHNSLLTNIYYTNEVLNDYEGVYVRLSSLYGNGVGRIDLRENRIIWSTSLNTSNLNNPKFNETKSISKTHTHFTYEISYTEYSGNKGVIKFKVNIETGEIEYL